MPELLIGVFLLLLLLNTWATYGVIKDELCSRGQRIAQIIIVWGLPVLGALFTLYTKRHEPERASGRYREAREPGDDFGYSGRSHRQDKDRLESETSNAEGDG